MAIGACSDADIASEPAVSSDTAPQERPADLASLPLAVQTLEVEARDHTFEFSPPATGALRPGWTQVRVRNDGAEAHQVMFARLRPGVDMAKVAEAAAGDSSGAAAIEFVDMLGGVSYIGPGREVTALVDLPEGMVLAMCYVPDERGVAHALMGMTATLSVSKGAAQPDPPLPERQEELVGKIEMADDGYRFPRTLDRGWYQVTNSDVVAGEPAQGLHELSILKLAEPVDAAEAQSVVDDLAANRTPEVGVEAMGGLGALSAGLDGYLYLDLPKGDYLGVDFMPDPGKPRPHMADGYYKVLPGVGVSSRGR